MTRTLLDEGGEVSQVKTVRSTSQLERFFKQAGKLFSNGPVSALKADLALAEICLLHNVRVIMMIVLVLKPFEFVCS